MAAAEVKKLGVVGAGQMVDPFAPFAGLYYYLLPPNIILGSGNSIGGCTESPNPSEVDR
jgi:hypothetical protein